ncbi:Gfo/Idh/MocA family protein [Saccharicrinis sp. GN24d3]|uniref:Gfo/Idh/MocA family protein n=1 Tax=Saccharicrinis sp. GN24d3 TaxID=3458416 RepID=UPI004036966C
MKKIKIGVLGVSNHLIKRIVLPLQNTKNCEIYAIASRNAIKAQQFANEFGIERVHDSYEVLLEDPDIDFVYIPLPNHLHLKWVKKAAMAKKHVLCEKPIALDTKQAQECVDIANKNGVKLMEAFMYKFHPLWIHVKDMVRTNQIGKIMYINASFAYNNPAPDNIRNKKDFGGGAVMDIGCYAISVPRFLLDQEPDQVISIHQKHNEFHTDTLSSAILDFNGTHASYTVSTLSHANQYVEVIGSSGRIRVHIPFNTYVDTRAEILVSTGQGDRTVTFEVCDQYGLMFDAFATSIINNSPTPVNVSDAVNNMKVIDALFRSNETRKWERIG